MTFHKSAIVDKMKSKPEIMGLVGKTDFYDNPEAAWSWVAGEMGELQKLLGPDDKLTHLYVVSLLASEKRVSPEVRKALQNARI